MAFSRIAVLTVAACCLAFVSASAQQSLKSKSKDRFRERGIPQVTARNLRNLNGAGTDLGISYFQKGLLYFSQGKASPVSKTQKPYFAAFNAAGTPAKAAVYNLQIKNKPAALTGPVGFSQTGKRAFATMLQTEAGVARHRIVEVAGNGAEMNLVSTLDALNGAFHTLHPFLSPDGTKLFFASDRPGGQGGFDLYVSEWKGGQWQAPVNLGPAINTTSNDLYPHYTAAGTLFFASAGHPTLGGLDIFAVAGALDQPKEVVNLGEPFNSAKNDFNFLLGADGQSGFFVSNRGKGAGKDDIYRFAGWKGIE
jgi:hypothetical protein